MIPTRSIFRTGACIISAGQSLGVPAEVTESVLNHISGKRARFVGIYNRYKYDADKRTALESWDAKLRSITE